MCGISVYVSKQSETDGNAAIQKMNDLIAHRGPDGDGFYHEGALWFGHRRLAILDLSDQGKQPMFWEDRYVITYNGEIYNYLEIREELKKKGYSFKTECDTEVILASYDCWGEDCVQRFNGMWAFAIHDKEKNHVFFSRDRFGIKPLYFIDNSHFFAAGSEIKQLLHLLNEVKACEDTLLEFLITGLEECDNKTFFKDVYKVMGGHNLLYQLDNHSHTIQPFYSINFNTRSHNLEDGVKDYKMALEKAVEIRLRSDVKVGTCLSGGLDSSSVAAIAAQKYQANHAFKAIHAKSEEAQTDESDYAKMVAEHCQLDLSIVEPSYEDFASKAEEVIYTQEEPFGSPSVAMQYFVLKKAREEGCIVMLDGQGGDETLLGYEKYYPAYLKGKGSLIVNTFKSSRNSKLSLKDAILFQFYFTNYRLRLKRLKKKNAFVLPKHLKNFKSHALQAMANSYQDIRTLQDQEIRSTQLPHLLKYEDKNSMRHSVETRLPFIDVEALETALNSNDEYKIKDGWTKYLLRKVVDNILPKKVVWRKNKLGFNAPESIWLKKHGQIMKDAVETSPLLKQYINQSELNFFSLPLRTQWKLYNVAIWEKLYQVQSN